MTYDMIDIPDVRIKPRSAGAIDLLTELREAVEARDFEAASRLRRALVLARPRWQILPLISPASASFALGEGGGQ